MRRKISRLPGRTGQCCSSVSPTNTTTTHSRMIASERVTRSRKLKENEYSKRENAVMAMPAVSRLFSVRSASVSVAIITVKPNTIKSTCRKKYRFRDWDNTDHCIRKTQNPAWKPVGSPDNSWAAFPTPAYDIPSSSAHSVAANVNPTPIPCRRCSRRTTRSVIQAAPGARSNAERCISNRLASENSHQAAQKGCAQRLGERRRRSRILHTHRARQADLPEARRHLAHSRSWLNSICQT